MRDANFPRDRSRNTGKPNTVTGKAVSGNGGIKDVGGRFSDFAAVH